MISMLQLKYFQELAVQQNMTRVAEKHFVSQTALSASLSRLEEELNVPLFTRLGRTLILNEYGETFLRYTNVILNAMDDGIKALADQAQQNEGRIFVATHSSMNWAKLIGEFMASYPEYNVYHKECVLSVMNAALPNLDIDLIIAGTEDILSPYMEHIEFKRDKILMVVPKEHPFASRERITLAEAKNEAFIMQTASSGFRKITDKVFETAGFTPKVVAECDYALRYGLLQKLSAVLLSSDTSKDAQIYGPNVAYLSLEDVSVTRGISIFWKKDKKCAPGAECFREFVLRKYRVNE